MGFFKIFQVFSVSLRHHTHTTRSNKIFVFNGNQFHIFDVEFWMPVDYIINPSSVSLSTYKSYNRNSYLFSYFFFCLNFGIEKEIFVVTGYYNFGQILSVVKFIDQTSVEMCTHYSAIWRTLALFVQRSVYIRFISHFKRSTKTPLPSFCNYVCCGMCLHLHLHWN